MQLRFELHTICKFCRWTVIFHPNEKEQDETKKAILNDTPSANTNEDTTTIFVMNNYFGMGIDAELCLDFHTAREEKPDKFNSRWVGEKILIKVMPPDGVNIVFNMSVINFTLGYNL